MRKIIVSVLKSPIPHFILLGLVAFFLCSNLKPQDRETIHVTTQTIDALVQQRESITQSPITPEERWILIEGHIESFRGIHYVRVTHSHDPELPPFERMESYLRTDYLMQKSRDSQQAKIDDFKKNYEIIVEGK
jgi:hypothetical protein